MSWFPCEMKHFTYLAQLIQQKCDWSSNRWHNQRQLSMQNAFMGTAFWDTLWRMYNFRGKWLFSVYMFSYFTQISMIANIASVGSRFPDSSSSLDVLPRSHNFCGDDWVGAHFFCAVPLGCDRLWRCEVLCFDLSILPMC